MVAFDSTGIETRSSTSPTAPAVPTANSSVRVLSLRPYLPTAAEKGPSRPDGTMKEGAGPKNETGFPDEVVAEQTTAMEQRISRLIKLSTERGFDAMMGNGIHFMDRELLNLLATHKPNGRGGETYTGIDRDAFNKFMNTARGQELTYMVRQYDLILMSLGAAVRATITPASGTPRAVQGESIPISGRGWARGLFDKLGEITGRPVGDTEGRPSTDGWLQRRDVGSIIRSVLLSSGALGVAGTFLGGPLGGAAGALLPPAIVGIIDSLKEGKHIDVVQCYQALQTLNGGEPQPLNRAPRPTPAGNIQDAQRAWLRTFAGIDPTDLEVTQGRNGPEIQYRENHIAGTLYEGRELRDRIVKESMALQKFQKAIGVPDAAIQGSDIDWIYNGNNGPLTGRGPFPYQGPSQPGQRGLDIDRRVMDAFQPNRGGIRFFNPETGPNGAWETLEVQTATGEWITNPYLERSRTQPLLNIGARQDARTPYWDIEGNARRYLEAYQQTIQRELALAVDEVRNGNVDYYGRYVTSINDQLAGLAAGGDLLKQRKESSEKRQELYTNLKDRTNQDGWNAYEKAVGDLSTKRTELAALEQDLTTEVTSPGGGAAGMTQEAALRHILTDATVRATTTDPLPATVQINGESVGSIQTQLNEVEATIQAQINAQSLAITGRAVRPLTADERKDLNDYKAQLESTRNALRAPILAQQQEILQRLKALDDARKAIKDQEAILSERGQVNGDRQKTAEQNIAAYTRLHLTAGISQTDLSTQSYEEILEQVNAFGLWPESENGLEENQQTILQAIIEARVRATLPNRSPQYRDTTRTVGITDNQLLTLPPARIEALINGRIVAAPPASRLNGLTPLTLPEIQAVQEEAAQRMRIRGEAVSELEEELTRESNRAQYQATRAEKPPELRQLEMYKRTVSTWGNIDGRLASMQATSNADLRLLTDTTYVLPGMAGTGHEYVDAEARAGRGYLRWLDIIFDYQQARDLGGRGAALQIARQLLPEQDLSNLLQTRFISPTAPARTLDEVLTDLEPLIADGRVSSYDIRRFIQQNVVLGYFGRRVTTF